MVTSDLFHLKMTIILFFNVLTINLSVHKLCSNQNGMCAGLCLPTGDNSYKCACSNGEHVDSEGLCPGGM